MTVSNIVDFLNVLLKKLQNSGTILVTDNIDQGVKGSDVIATDVWVSMGEPDDTWEERIKLLEPYRVTKRINRKQAIHILFLNTVYLLSIMQKQKLVNKLKKNMV